MKEIETIKELEELLKGGREIANCAFQNLDLIGYEERFKQKEVTNCLFMGCNISNNYTKEIIDGKNLVFPAMDVPFETYPADLYTRDTMYNNFNPDQPESYNNTYDKKTYDHYVKNGRHSPDSIYETLARRLHDHSITDALMDILDNVPAKKVVAIMGGHGLSRKSSDYLKVAQIAKALSEKDFFLLSGGGPGAMEATHLGVWFDGYSDSDMQKGIDLIAQAPMFNDELWLSKAFEVINKFPKISDKENDIGIPTWLYGHEPPTPFASKIAKYFANSVREEGLLALATGGIIYTPGSAGTIQEIFQDATQNHYNSYGIISPMIFYNKTFWTKDKPVYPLLKKLAEGFEYENLLSISDDVSEIVDELVKFSNS
ncbi:MAG: hypothetical protein GY760_06240 [Deltaproteobacteria bacterium]|nr:hypothetical protein [Deltaproteobacteria bacterium]